MQIGQKLFRKVLYSGYETEKFLIKNSTALGRLQDIQIDIYQNASDYFKP
jgi:hypothetical protein